MADVGAAKPYHQATAGIRFAVRHIRDHLDEPLADNHLAQRAGMSRTAFDRHFKATTTLSPLQYVKALRLNGAAMRIACGTDTTRAATDVGHASPSQFSREFKRHFGTTPRMWALNNAGSIDPMPSRSPHRRTAQDGWQPLASTSVT